MTTTKQNTLPCSALDLKSDKAGNASYKKLMTAITAYGKQAAKMDDTLHALACLALNHANAYGDARPIDALIKNLGKSQRVKGLMVWVETFSPVRWNGDGNVGIQKATAKGYTPYDLAKAEVTPFWELSASNERTAKPLTMELLTGMINRLEKRLEKEEKEGKLDTTEAPALHATIAKLKAAVAA